MFKGIANFAQMVRQAQELQSRLEEMKQGLASLRAEGSAGGGMVTVQATGDQRILSIRIDDSLIKDGDRELTEELVVAAVNQALERARAAAAAQMQAATSSIPGMSDVLSQAGLTP